MIAIGILLGWYVLLWATMAAALLLAQRLLRFEKKGIARAAAAAALVLLLLFGIAILGALVESRTLLVSLLYTAAAFAGIWYAVKRVYGTTQGTTWAALGFLLMAIIVHTAVALLVVRPFLVEAFRIPLMSMAPTLLGEHRVAECPTCKGRLLVDSRDPRLAQVMPTQALCADCGARTEVPPGKILGTPAYPDRILVTKFLKPARWDVAAFRMPRGDIYLKRVVALPGETLAIDPDGRLIIDGKPIEPPGKVKRFEWPPDLKEGRTVPGIQWTIRPGETLRLQPDEYFMLGDNTRFSYDSRLFGPVKQKDLVGVAQFIYAPLGRIGLVR